MTYRDSFEKCPRCGIELTDARSARACPGCRGLWVSEQVVTEMVLEMLPPGPLSRLVLEVIVRTGAPIGCPSCGEPMVATEIHQLVLDHCPRHGIWFDGEELELALRRVAEPGRPPPLEPIDIAERSRRRHTPPPPPAGARELVFHIVAPGQPPRSVRLAHEIIKIGTLVSAHLHLADDRVSRMHAVIQQGADEIELIDLGSATGTLVNGTQITRMGLRSGDRIELGETVVTISFAG